MASTRSWLRLPLPSSSDLPVLLVSVDIGTAEYTIHVTDMANVWTESLDRKAICIRGWAENTTIDPSDTAENMTKFLTSLRSALDSSQPDHDRTRLELTPASKSDAGEDGLTLKITHDLPGLPALKWPMHLRKSPPSTVATGLVLPLIEAHLMRGREVQSLVRTIEHKDAIISKLLDKLEAVGTGLEHVFNPLSGRKKVTRAVAEDKVPGLGPFSRRQWKLDLQDQEDGPNNADALVAEVFGQEGLQYQDVLGMDESPRLDTWWQEFKGASRNSGKSQTKAAVLEEESRQAPQNSLEAEDDDFQVQSTPPHLRSTRESKDVQHKSPSVKDTVGGRESLPLLQSDAARRFQDTDLSPKVETKKPSRLGALGRKKQSTPARSPSPLLTAASKSGRSIPEGEESETASEAEDGATASLPDDEHYTPEPPPQKSMSKKGVLGRIGGPKLQSSSGRPSATPEPDTTGLPTQTSTRSTHKKLGTIGKKADEPEISEMKQDEPRGRARKAAHSVENDSRPRETSQERADRKRAELKRDLEKKAAAGPAKKKRKF